METKELTESQKALRLLAGAMLAGLLSVPIYAAQAEGWKSFLTIISVGVLLAGASALVAGTLGFLFGIPRTLQQEGANSSTEANPAAPQAGSAPRRVDYRANTNLEQISDWLTKILVGVGLTQITEIRSGLASLSAFAAKGLGAQDYNQVFAFALLSYSAVLGFLFGYLWTRLFLAGALRLADQAAIGALVAEVQKVTEKAETTERKLDELKKQSELDAAALNLASRQLNPSPDLPEVTQDALDMAVAAASRPVKVQLFNQAWQVRADNWRDVNNKPKMERSISVFRALIHNDVENRYHTNHGQLGFALKDKAQPEWAEAEKELTTAIEIRGAWKKHGWLLYELNRAFCRIMLDPAFGQDQRSDPDLRKLILQDLRAAAQVDDLREILRTDPVFRKWISLNAISEKELRRT